MMYICSVIAERKTHGPEALKAFLPADYAQLVLRLIWFNAPFSPPVLDAERHRD